MARILRGAPGAIILAAGDGTRLSSLTRDADGSVVPKQFCSLNGSVSLINQTLARAAAVVPRERITVVVAPAHVRYWKPALGDIASGNIIVQPLNRGTAVGILLPTLIIIARDPEACILVLPSDHYVADESILEDAMRHAIDDIRHYPAGVALLGIEAHEADPELGCIIPRAGRQTRLRHIAAGQEKRLAVMAVPRCGWNDLGTPHRLAQVLNRNQKEIPVTATTARKVPNGCVNLSERMLTSRACGCGSTTCPLVTNDRFRPCRIDPYGGGLLETL